VSALLAHALLLLCAHWSVRLRAALCCTPAARVEEATLLLLLPASKQAGPPQQLPLSPARGFEYRKREFAWDAAAQRFRKRSALPGGAPPQLLSSYSTSRGLATAAEVESASALHPPNSFAVPLPSLRRLLLEQCLQPFAVFQFFSVALMCLDELWLTSLATLAMLLLFEASVVFSRQRTAAELRSQLAPRQALLALRSGAWAPLPAERLLPGDVVSLVPPPSGGGARERAQVAPADLLLFAGSAIANEALLTGESAPQWKEAAEEAGAGGEELSLKRHRAHIVYAGTQVVQSAPPAAAGGGGWPAKLRPPDGGAPALVLRTGFCTEQGKLMRTFLFSGEAGTSPRIAALARSRQRSSVSAQSAEAFMFIACLLAVGLCAAGHVLVEGLRDERRSRWKLLLHVIMVLTSVVPPELPIELTVAVNASLAALARAGVYCTEPFRIPLAGKLDVACFDKTGTLTRDELLFVAVASSADEAAAAAAAAAVSGAEGAAKQPPPPPPPPLAALCLAACHSLVLVDGRLAGDPLEMAALAGLGWSAGGGGGSADSVSPPQGSAASAAKILRRLPFRPELRRMAVVARRAAPPPSAADAAGWVLCKGAPEAVLPLCNANDPGLISGWGADPDAAYAALAAAGLRVLALAARPLAAATDVAAAAASSAPRVALEEGLTFLGFALFASPLRPCSAPALAALRDARIAPVMLTGDGALTACHVARQTRILTRPFLTLARAGGGALEWRAEGAAARPFLREALPALARQHDLCVTGEGVEEAARCGALDALVLHTQVYARCAPGQKEAVLAALRRQGLTCLMCGDGTNDCGALKAAAVGVALVTEVAPRRGGAAQARGRPQADALSSHAPPAVRLGDASMAAPFTSRRASVASCVQVREWGQWRCYAFLTHACRSPGRAGRRW